MAFEEAAVNDQCVLLYGIIHSTLQSLSYPCLDMLSLLVHGRHRVLYLTPERILQKYPDYKWIHILIIETKRDGRVILLPLLM